MKANTFEGIIKELADLHRAKNADYGNSFEILYEKYGILSCLIRLSDKMLRIETLFSTGSQLVKRESVEDTLADLANYAIMTLEQLRKSESRTL